MDGCVGMNLDDIAILGRQLFILSYDLSSLLPLFFFVAFRIVKIKFIGYKGGVPPLLCV
jgi:hypothetical protein